MGLFFRIASLLSLTVLALAGHAPAFEFSGHKWEDSDLPLVYKVNPANKPAYIAADNFVTIVQKGFQTWNDVTCSDLEFSYGGITDATGAFDQTHVIFWNIDGNGMGNALGITRQWTNFNGDRLFDVDMELNGSQPWSVSEVVEQGKFDLQSVITHEAGHFLALNDLYGDGDRGKTMYGYLFSGDSSPRTLDPDDQAGICYIYPVNELSILTISLPKALLTYPYDQQLRAGGGTPPYRWQVISGSLPEGLSLTKSSGNINGVPQTESTFSFTIEVTDLNGVSVGRTFTIEVRSINQPDIFGVEIGNRWISRGTNYERVEEFVSLDQNPFPVRTYLLEERENGVIDARSWYEREGGFLRLWGMQQGAGGDFYKFSSGLLVGWNPVQTGDHNYTTATTNISGYIFDVSMTVDVLSREKVVLDFASLEAFKVRYLFRIWGYGTDETQISYQWWVPYLASIKYEDNESHEVLTSFTINGGSITQITDADGDGLKDYEELVLYGTYWQEADTDGDTCNDGAEVLGGRNPTAADPQGDVNGDCRIDLQDVIIVLQVQSGAGTAHVLDLAADVNGDNKIGFSEVFYVLQRIANLR